MENRQEGNKMKTKKISPKTTLMMKIRKNNFIASVKIKSKRLISRKNQTNQ